MLKQERKELFDRAMAWRVEQGYVNKLGVVTFFNGELQGWSNELRDPQNWQPGCVAVDEFGLIYKTVGGDPQNGAAEWCPITSFGTETE